MKVFVDANTIVSGLLFAGNEATLLELGRLGVLHLVSNEYVLGEVRAVLRRKEFHVDETELQHLLRYVLECISIVENPPEEKIRKHYNLLRDKKDLPVVLGAKIQNCQYLVTGDKELLSEKVRRFVNTTTASRLLEKLMKEKFVQF
jgi:putative PIN family toxin of toxin-antitoxin system